MTAYYNEIDPYAAQWLRNLIDAGHIAGGVVDERSIEDVRPSDLVGFSQCHFFAGVGVWSLALRRAGVPDDAAVWTGSCPCQPFSAAGKGEGMDDERHLWPSFHHLIAQCRPAIILGEQVASKDGLAWLDVVLADLEEAEYAAGAVDTCAAGVGAPHLRQRLYWVAHTAGSGQPWLGWRRQAGVAEHRNAHWLADAYGGNASAEGIQRLRQYGQQPQDSGAGELAHTEGERCGQGGSDAPGRTKGAGTQGAGSRPTDASCGREPGPVNGLWRAADWLLCRDGRLRPVEPGTFPLADGSPARVGRLRAYGNAINAEAARIFIEAVMEAA